MKNNPKKDGSTGGAVVAEEAVAVSEEAKVGESPKAAEEAPAEAEKQKVYVEELVTEYRDKLKQRGYFFSKKNAHWLFTQTKKEAKTEEPSLLAKVTIADLKKRGIDSTKATTEIRKMRKRPTSGTL